MIKRLRDRLFQRARDLLHERAILKQTKQFLAAQECGALGDATREWEGLRTLLLHRSPQQVARLERAQLARMDEHARAIFERGRDS